MTSTKKSLFIPILILIPLLSFSQVQPSSADIRMQAFEVRKQLKAESLVKNVPFENIGPSIFSGRIVDVDVNAKDPTHFYAAYASGGLWYTESNGTILKPVFDNESSMTIGDVAVDWENNIVWVGSGENNSSRSSYAGTGIFKSTDGGANWTNMGLPESHHISRIILHPTNPNVVWVAVLGHLYSANEERGVYKTSDGGMTWKRTLYVDENSGAADLVIDPQNPNTLYASTWHRERRAWDLNEGGEGSGIHKSTDGGETWTNVTDGRNGFPIGELTGRIGLDMFNDGNTEVIYAILDNYNRRPKEDDKEATDDLTKEDFRTMSDDAFLALNDKKLDAFLSGNGFPEKYNAKKVKAMAKDGKLKPMAMVEYLEDANSLLFDTPVIGAEVYASRDGGKSWQKMNSDYIDDLYNSYGYYFGQVRVSPLNPDKIYVLGVPILKSEDGGKTYQSIDGSNVHSDHHSIWVSPTRDGHLINGNDGGLNISYDDGKSWLKMNQPPVGQFYSIAVDMAKPYNVYGGLQDNGVWMGPNTYQESTRWQNSGQYPYKAIMGGDGMQVAVDTRDNETVYTGLQFGNYFRLNTKTESRKFITPKHELGDRPHRWNWETPIWLSTHNQDIFYMGSHKLLRSFNQGDDFQEISGDLTQGGRKGDVAYGTLTSIHESPLAFGLIYTGSDDGLIHVTKDGGRSWSKISDNLPQDLWVASVQASAYEESRVYASLNGYRWDDFNSYCYMSDDYGANWTKIGANLPAEPVNVLKEDPTNDQILYVGTDHGTYISLDRGKTFMAFSEGLPDVPVHDLIVHPRENHLLLATHGRSFFKADVSQVQQLDEATLSKQLVFFKPEDVNYNARWGSKRANWGDAFEPEMTMLVYSNSNGSVQFNIENEDGEMVYQSKQEISKGINYMDYDLTIDQSGQNAMEKLLNKKLKDGEEKIKLKKADNGKVYMPAAKYTARIGNGGQFEEQVFEVKERRR